jgi:SAM-dependent methyltransferase
MSTTSTRPVTGAPTTIERGAGWFTGEVQSEPAPTAARMGQIFGFARGLHAIHLVDMGVKLGLFEALERTSGGLADAELAGELGLQPRYTQVWCEAACGLELLDLENGRYRLAPGFDAVLGDPSAAYYLGAFARAHLELARDYEAAADHFRAGTVHRFSAHDEPFLESVAAATAVLPRMFMDAVLPGLEGSLRKGARVIDVGCGGGFAMTQLAAAFPETSYVGVDVDPVSVRLATALAEEAGLAERIEVRVADGSELPSDLAGQFDLATMFLVLHEVEPELKPAVLAQCFAALRPGGRLLLFDERFPSTPSELRDPTLIFAVMAQWYEATWGNEMQSREQIRESLEAAGFRIAEETDLSRFYIVVAERPE